MAEIKFKISGNSPTFVASIYDASLLVQRKYVTYPDTCVTFSNLCYGKQYALQVSDTISNHDELCFTTGTITGVTPTFNKTISFAPKTLSGNTTQCYGYGSVSVVNPLSIGESVILNMEASISNISNASSVIAVKCKPNNGVLTTIRTITNPGNTVISPIPMLYGDAISYDINTSATNNATNDICGDAFLQLVSLSGATGFNAILAPNSNIYTCLNVPAIIPPPPPPNDNIVVNLEILSVAELNGSRCTISRLSTTPPLVQGQSVRVNFHNYTIAEIYNDALSHAMHSQSCRLVGTACYATASSTIYSNTTNTTDENSTIGYVTIDCSNINSTCFSNKALIHVADQECPRTLIAHTVIDDLTYQTNGTYVIGQSISGTDCYLPPE